MLIRWIAQSSLSTTSTSTKTSQDLVVALELGVEGIVKLAANAEVDSRVQALSTPPDVSFVVALLNLVGDVVEAGAVTLVDVGNEDGMGFGTDQITVLALLAIVLLLPAANSLRYGASRLELFLFQDQVALGSGIRQVQSVSLFLCPSVSRSKQLLTCQVLLE